MQRRSITFVNRVYPPSHGATGRILRDLAKAFVKEGWNVKIITTGHENKRELDGAIRVIRVKATEKPAGIGAYLWVLAKLAWTALRQPKQDIIVTMTDPPLLALLGHWVKTIKKSKHIHWSQDVYPDLLPALGKMPRPVLMKVAQSLHGKALRRADKVIVIGRCMAKTMLDKGVGKDSITIIPNWPDAELVTEQSTESPYHSEKSRHFRVLYAGTLGMAHPVKTILQAADILQETNPHIEFRFVGEGAGYEALAEERSRLHLDNIRLLPFQPAEQLATLMQSGDVHLISMTDDAAGLLVPSKLYAALAAHRPAIFIGPKASEAAKVITDYNAGTVIPQGDAQALVQAIELYSQNSDLWYGASQGAAKAADIFTPQQSIKAWVKRATALAGSDKAI